MTTDTKTIEQSFEELDKIMEKLESPDITLEESFQYYEAGMKLIQSCSEKIDTVEKKIIVLHGGEVSGDA